MIVLVVVAHDGMYNTEDMVEITGTGHRVLSRSADWGKPMVVG
jgi:hypothetical protein